MPNLRYYTSSIVDDLRREVKRNLAWYYKPTGPPPLAGVNVGVRESNIEAPRLADRLLIDRENPSSNDGANALAVYDALSALTPHQASMERVWVWLCHNDCPSYVAGRWLDQRSGKHDGDGATKVRNHFFASGNRALVRDNGVARLWWLGKIANETDPEDPSRFLEILLHRLDVRSALIERPSVSMNRRVLRTIYRVMQEHWNDDRKLFERDIFRSWTIALNRRGGVVLLDAMSDDDLYRLIREEASAAVASRVTTWTI